MVSSRHRIVLIAPILSILASSLIEAEPSKANLDLLGPALKAANPLLESRARAICAAIDPQGDPQSCAAVSYPRVHASDTAGMYDQEFKCLIIPRGPEKEAYEMYVMTHGYFVKRGEHWSVAPLDMGPAADSTQPGNAEFEPPPPPSIAAPLAPAPPPSCSTSPGYLGWISRRIGASPLGWGPEIFGSVVILLLVLYATWGGAAQRPGLGGSLISLNIATGLIPGFYLGLLTLLAMPDILGSGGSTPLALYVISPAPLGALGAVVSFLGLGTMWAGLRQRTRAVRAVAATLQITLCIALCGAIFRCIVA